MPNASDSLKKNPKLSQDWIDAASKLIDNHAWSCDDIISVCGYDADKVEVLLDYATQSAKNNVALPFNDIFDPELNSTQMRLRSIAFSRLGSDRKDDIIACVNTAIPCGSSNYLLQGVIDGLDMTIAMPFADDPEKVYEIYAGLKNNVDVTIYAQPGISAIEMGLMRHALEVGYYVERDFDMYNPEASRIIITPRIK